MRINPILISLSDNDKRFILILFLVVLLVLALLAYLTYLIIKLFKFQGKRVDTLIHDVVVTNVITERKDLIRYGRIKNYALFFRQAFIPVIIVVVGVIFYLIKCALNNDFNYNLFNTSDGFGTIFYTWRLSNNFTDGTLIRFNTLEVDNYPHFIADAWPSYIAAPLILTGTIWYFIVSTGLLARTIKLRLRSREIFEKSLDGYNQNEANKAAQADNQQQSANKDSDFNY